MKTPARGMARTDGGDTARESTSTRVVVYLAIVVVVWQLVYLADRVLPIPDSLIASIPILGLIALPFAVNKLRLPIPDAALGRRTTTAIAVAIVLFMALVRVVQGPVLPCTGDCPSYMRMVEDIGFDASRTEGVGPWEGYSSQHYMRILPPLMVRGLTYTGVDAETGFRIVSGGAYVLFALILVGVLLRKARDPVFAVALTVLVLGVHRALTYSLRSVAYASDALSYPIALGLILLTLSNRWRWVFLLGLVGIVTKQHLLVLSCSALAYLWFKNRGRARIEITGMGLATVALYFGLSQHYQATEAVAKHLWRPGSGLEWINETLGMAIRVGILELFLAIVPLLIWYGRDVVRFLTKHWFIPVYCAVAIAQPAVGRVLESGGNILRTSMHGVWPLYLVVALVAVRRAHPAAWPWVVLAYAVAVYSHWDVGSRLIIVAVMLAVSGVMWLRFRQNDRMLGVPASPLRGPDGAQ